MTIFLGHSKQYNKEVIFTIDTFDSNDAQTVPYFLFAGPSVGELDSSLLRIGTVSSSSSFICFAGGDRLDP